VSIDEDYLEEKLKEYLDDDLLGELIPDEDTYDADYGWLDMYEETHQEEEHTETYDLTIDYLNFLYYNL
jgi:hypothetical protein